MEQTGHSQPQQEVNGRQNKLLQQFSHLVKHIGDWPSQPSQPTETRIRWFFLLEKSKTANVPFQKKIDKALSFSNFRNIFQLSTNRNYRKRFSGSFY